MTAAAFLLLALSSPAPADIQLARICVWEAGWSSIDAGDCAAIAAVHRRRFGSINTRDLCRYSRGACNPRRRQRRWVNHLGPEGHRPRHWPRRLSWAARRDTWLETLDLSRRLMNGERLDRCRRTPRHWAARWFTENADRNGWRRVSCGPTRNAFYL